MIKHSLLVYVERLRDGKSQIIKEELDPVSLDLCDEDLQCPKPVSVFAEAYLAGDWLVVRFDLSATLILPCSFCNEPFVLPVKLEALLHEESLENLFADVFDLLPLLRETLLLEVPFYPQCGTTTCLRRHEFEKYFKRVGEEGDIEEEGYRPFSNL